MYTTCPSLEYSILCIVLAYFTSNAGAFVTNRHFFNPSWMSFWSRRCNSPSNPTAEDLVFGTANRATEGRTLLQKKGKESGRKNKKNPNGCQ
jgi:hypothetical protein